MYEEVTARFVNYFWKCVILVSYANEVKLERTNVVKTKQKTWDQKQNYSSVRKQDSITRNMDLGKYLCKMAVVPLTSHKLLSS